ncbi:hypothetical protein H0H93_007702 [Arthromyces matolae]|nr:hypothetical protein H0H93_007702 [Arthromyces matolae]
MDIDQSPSTDKPDAKVVIITNLTRNVAESHLQTIFSFYGTINKIDLPVYGKSGQNRGKAALEFADASSAHKAFTHMDGGQLDGAALKLELSNLPVRSRSPTPPPPSAPHLALVPALALAHLRIEDAVTIRLRVVPTEGLHKDDVLPLLVPHTVDAVHLAVLVHVRDPHPVVQVVLSVRDVVHLATLVGDMVGDAGLGLAAILCAQAALVPGLSLGPGRAPGPGLCLIPLTRGTVAVGAGAGLGQSVVGGEVTAVMIFGIVDLVPQKLELLEVSRLLTNHRQQGMV